MLPIANFRYKYMSETALLWTVFMFQASQTQNINDCDGASSNTLCFQTVPQNATDDST